MKKIGQYCLGQVRVCVKGTQIGRFLSVLSVRGIRFEEAAYEGSDFMVTLDARKYRAATACAKKTGVRLKIVSKRGWPFFYFRHRRRKWTVVFILPMILVFLMLPRFVWSIEIDGLESVSRTEMMTRLEQLGISTGMRKDEVDTEGIKNELLLRYDDLSFASLKLEGTQLKVLVEEAVAAPEIVDRKEVCDVIAGQSCVIYSIVTESGRPLVKAGDEVQAGQTLIAGQVVLTDDAGNELVVPIHAAGEVYGTWVWQAEEEMERSYLAQIWSGNTKSGYEICCGSKALELRWPFGKAEQEGVIKEVLWSLPFGDWIMLYRLSYEAYTLEQREYSNEELEIRLQEKLERRAAQVLQQGDRIALEKQWQMEETESGMKAMLKMEIMEDVGKQEKKMEQD